MTTMIKLGSSLAAPVRRVSLLALLVAGLAAALPTAAHAQYFGRNKIQYEKFDWYVLSTERFNIHVYTAEDDTMLYDAGSMAGPEVTQQKIAPYLWQRGITRIDEVFLSYNDGLTHSRMYPQGCFHFSRFDSMATNLHLLIHSP